MDAVENSVRSLIVPMEGMDMLLPNVAIAEIINYQPIDPMHEGPDWLLGRLRWRNQDVPVISIEKMCGFEPENEGKKLRISVINSVQSGSPLKFYAVVIGGIPRSVQMDEDIAGASQRGEKKPLTEAVADYVRIDEQDIFIPNLEAIQSMVEADFS